MQGFSRFALRLVPALLVMSVALPPALCAQEVDAPAAGGRSGSVFAPSSWMMVIAPVQKRVDLKMSGFYIGELGVPVAQVDVGIHATKFLTITPSWMYYSVPASGQNELSALGGATETYDEHQFRIDGTVAFSIRKLEISARNMYVRRFRPAPAEDANRYRGRIGIAHPVAVMGRFWKPFASYEAYYEQTGDVWNRDRLWGGVTVPVMNGVLFQPSYMYEKTDGLNDVHYLLFGLMVSTR